MYDANVTLRQGEIRPLYAQANAALSDTLTIQAAPATPYSAPTFTLLDATTGIAVAGYTSIAILAGSYQSGALAGPLLWHILDTSGLNPGVYIARFVFAVQSTLDGLMRELACEVQVCLLAALEALATYDPSNALGQARLYCLDTDMAQAIFSDTEILQFLQDTGGMPLLAAALALELLATDHARLATVLKIGTFGENAVGIYKALAERAARLRHLAPVLPIVAATSSVFPDLIETVW